MLDIERVMDVEVLRTVARLQGDEIQRRHAKVTALTRSLAAAQKADDATVQKLLLQLDDELREARDQFEKEGSERRPRKDIASSTSSTSSKSSAARSTDADAVDRSRPRLDPRG